MPQIVMIVDDDQMNRELLETVVKRAGYAVNHANSGAQALRMVAAAAARSNSARCSLGGNERL